MNLEGVAKLLQVLKGVKWWWMPAILLMGVSYYYKDTIDKALDIYVFNKGSKNVEKGITKTKLINAALEELLYYSAADRAYIFQFHNGTVYYTGTHKNKMSCDYEVVAPGISPQAMNLQDLPVSLFSEMIDEVIALDMHYGDVNNVKHVRTRVMLKANGVHSISLAPYYDNHGNLVAMIGVDYVAREANVDDILNRTGLDSWNSNLLWQIFMSRTNQIGDLL